MNKRCIILLILVVLVAAPLAAQIRIEFDLEQHQAKTIGTTRFYPQTKELMDASGFTFVLKDARITTQALVCVFYNANTQELPQLRPFDTSYLEVHLSRAYEVFDGGVTLMFRTAFYGSGGLNHIRKPQERVYVFVYPISGLPSDAR